MKAITLIIAVLILTGSTLLASGTDTKTASAGSSPAVVEANILAPVTPMEATFDDATVAFTTPVDAVALAPATPANADFDDYSFSGPMPGTAHIAPITPTEADFNDFINPENEGNRLAPATPATAEFEMLPE